MAFRFNLITLFPEFFPGALSTGLLGKALRERRAEVGYIDPRRFATDRHRTVDDAPYGGGAGMVMKVEPLVEAIRAARNQGDGPVVMMSPQGRPMEQGDFERWRQGEQLTLVCGRYEGFDERVRTYTDDEVSLGDFVLTGGEYAALTIIDGVLRLMPGTLGNQASATGDSFTGGLLEYPQYTRPEVYAEQAVPEVLRSGHHRRVETWRRAQQWQRTHERRPDLLASVLSAEGEAIPLAPLGGEIRLRVGAVDSAEEPNLSAVAAAYGVSDVRLGIESVASGLALEPEDTLHILVDTHSSAPVCGPESVRRWLRSGRSTCVYVDVAAELLEGTVDAWRVLPAPRCHSHRSLSGAAKVAVVLDRICSES